MNLLKKKALASSVLGAGKGRIIFNTSRLNEIKDAMTKQDIRDLFASGAIFIKDIQGRKKIEKRSRRRTGSIKKKVRESKRVYMTITRKLRRYIKELIDQEKITKEQYLTFRKEIKAHSFRSKAHLKEKLPHIK